MTTPESAKAAGVVQGLRAVYATGKTRAIEWRVSQLEAILAMITRHEAEITEALRLDLNKPPHEAYVYDIAGTVGSCKNALKNLRQWMRPEKVKTSIISYPSSAMIVPEPLGVVLVISTWNFPIILSLDPIIGAIAADNVVVLKPSELALASSSLLSRLLGQYMDTSAVKVIEGAVSLLSAHQLFSTITKLQQDEYSQASGEVCIGPDYILTTKAYALKLMDALSFELEKFYGVDPLQSNDLSRIMNSIHFDRLTKLLDDEKIAGKVVHGGHCDKAKLKIAPTIILDPPQDSLIMNEEIFGPLLPIITVNKLEDCISQINSREKPLAAYLFTNNDKLKDEFITGISAGGMTINDTILHFGELALPFGGVGESGMGAYHGRFSFDAFSHRKPVLLRGFKGDVSARYPPYSSEKLTFMKAILSGNIFSVLRALVGW